MLNLGFKKKLHQTRFTGVLFSGARNDGMKKYSWVSEDASKTLQTR